MSLNHIVLVGTVDRPPEKRTTPDGIGTTTFKMKVLRPARVGPENEDAGAPASAPRGDRFDFVPVICLRRLSDTAAELRAGETVAVEGRLETYQLPGEQYKNGIRVFAESVQRLGVGAPAPTNGGYDGEHAAQPAPAAAAATASGSYADELPPDLDDSIPF